MTTFTRLEVQIFNSLVEYCFSAYSSSAKELADQTGLPVDTVKGVLGSLVKKELVQVCTDTRSGQTFKDVWPVIEGKALCYGWDYYSQQELEGFKLK